MTSIIPVFTVFKDTAITKGLVFWILRGVTKLYINACVKCTETENTESTKETRFSSIRLGAGERYRHN